MYCPCVLIRIYLRLLFAKLTINKPIHTHAVRGPPTCMPMAMVLTGIWRADFESDQSLQGWPKETACLHYHRSYTEHAVVFRYCCNRARRQSGFPTFISCKRQDANVLPKRRQSHQGDKLCDVSTVPLVARWPVFLARGSDADGEPHSTTAFGVGVYRAL